VGGDDTQSVVRHTARRYSGRVVQTATVSDSVRWLSPPDCENDVL